MDNQIENEENQKKIALYKSFLTLKRLEDEFLELTRFGNQSFNKMSTNELDLAKQQYESVCIYIT